MCSVRVVSIRDTISGRRYVFWGKRRYWRGRGLGEDQPFEFFRRVVDANSQYVAFFGAVRPAKVCEEFLYENRIAAPRTGFCCCRRIAPWTRANAWGCWILLELQFRHPSPLFRLGSRFSHFLRCLRLFCRCSRGLSDIAWSKFIFSNERLSGGKIAASRDGMDSRLKLLALWKSAAKYWNQNGKLNEYG